MTHTLPLRTRHLLVLAYYFPPMGMSGVQRVSKLVKYLPEHGWRVTVVTPTPGGYFAYDESLVEDVEREGVRIIRTRSLDPTRLFGTRKVVRLPAESRRQIASRFTNLVFVPDNKVGWLPFARNCSISAHRTAPFDAILSSAPPYTSHLAALAVSRRLRIPLVSDFRDDWLANPRHTYPSRLHYRLNKRLELRVVRSSTACSTINRVIADSLRRRAVATGYEPRIEVIPQGFDPADFPTTIRSHEKTAGRMHLLYSGVFYGAQSPDPFLTGLSRLLTQRPELRDTLAADFVGLVPPTFGDTVRDLGLSDVVVYHGYESHSAVVNRMADADVLWLTIGRQEGSEGISTGKLYEYIGSRKPILGLVPRGVARDDLTEYGAATVVEPDQPAEIAAAIEGLCDAWVSRELPVPDPSFVRRFDRRKLAGQFATVLNSVVDGVGR